MFRRLHGVDNGGVDATTTPTPSAQEAPVLAPTLSIVQSTDPLGSFVGFGGMPLRVSQRSWPAGTPVEAAIAGTATPDRIVATEDGRALGTGWHRGASEAEVYFERYEVDGGRLVMVSHGWVDRLTRQITQTG
jgi:hypothetical protein